MYFLLTSAIYHIAIGAHGGSYSIYHALAVAINELKVDHKPDFTNTEPAVSLGPFPQWSDPKKIVAMDPLGHLAPWLYKDYISKEDVEIRPTIAITKAHMKLPELEQSVKEGRLKVDGKICLNDSGELAVTKFAVEPVWYLPGVAERFGIGMLSHVHFMIYIPILFPSSSFLVVFRTPTGLRLHLGRALHTSVSRSLFLSVQRFTEYDIAPPSGSIPS